MASRSLNRVILIGNLTRDPELKYTQTGTAFCSFGVATNRSWKTADGQQKDEVQYHRIVAWKKLAELCGKLLAKGRKVYLEGRLTYRTFTGRDEQQHTITEIVLDDFIVFGDGKRIIEAQEEPTVEETTIKSETEEIPPPEEENSNSKKEDVKVKENKNDKNEENVNPDDIPF